MAITSKSTLKKALALTESIDPCGLSPYVGLHLSGLDHNHVFRTGSISFVHTDGAPSVRVFTRADDDRRPRLVFSTRPVTVARHARGWTASFAGFAPGRARFAGFAPGAPVRTATGVERVGDDGEVELTASPGERIELPAR